MITLPVFRQPAAATPMIALLAHATTAERLHAGIGSPRTSRYPNLQEFCRSINEGIGEVIQ